MGNSPPYSETRQLQTNAYDKITDGISSLLQLHYKEQQKTLEDINRRLVLLENRVKNLESTSTSTNRILVGSNSSSYNNNNNYGLVGAVSDNDYRNNNSNVLVNNNHNNSGHNNFNYSNFNTSHNNSYSQGRVSNNYPNSVSSSSSTYITTAPSVPFQQTKPSSEKIAELVFILVDHCEQMQQWIKEVVSLMSQSLEISIIDSTNQTKGRYIEYSILSYNQYWNGTEKRVSNRKILNVFVALRENDAREINVELNQIFRFPVEDVLTQANGKCLLLRFKYHTKVSYEEMSNDKSIGFIDIPFKLSTREILIDTIPEELYEKLKSCLL